ncbi:MAG TPA: hypothetical protein VJM34_12140 [Novosphingobium sp.]|nr:hypothetical protein [Novosphingobium sp.]
MKLLRWAATGATVYLVYRYSIGKKAKGESVLNPSERAIADLGLAEESRPVETTSSKIG